MYKVISPILFLVFNRPQETSIVFNEIRKTKPKKLYIAADGPRNHQDKILCDEVRSIVSNVDWDCEVILCFRKENLGCKIAVSSAISWFFENEKEGIVLEDDIKPSPDFFRFMDRMLDYHRDDLRIRHITGYNFKTKKRPEEHSYYFSRWTGVWGWASWRRVWKDYDVSLQLLDEVLKRRLLDNITPDKMLVKNIETGLINTKNGIIDTWDIQLALSNFINDGLCIVPYANLITNIGFNKNATHTTDFSRMRPNNIINNMDELIRHPIFYVPDTMADTQTLMNEDNSSIFRKLKYRFGFTE